MCSINIQVDESTLREVMPELDTTAAIRVWAQQLIDLHMQQMRNGSGNQTTEEVFDAIEQRVKNRLQADMSVSADHAIDLETMRERLHRMVHEVYFMLIPSMVTPSR